MVIIVLVTVLQDLSLRGPRPEYLFRGPIWNGHVYEAYIKSSASSSQFRRAA